MFGEYKFEVIECGFIKVEKKYNSYDDFNMDLEGAKIGAECAEELIAREEMEVLRNLSLIDKNLLKYS